MLQNIHVKNMALIDEADVDFGVWLSEARSPGM